MSDATVAVAAGRTMAKLTYLARPIHVRPGEISRVTGGGVGFGSALSALVNTRHYIEATVEKGSVP